MSKCKDVLRLARTPRSGNDTPVAALPRIEPPAIPRGVAPPEVKLAMDSHNATNGVYDYANLVQTHEAFIGYPILAQLAQKPEFRLLTMKTAQAMVRNWIEFKSKSKADRSDRIKEIEAEMERLKVCDLFETMAVQNGFMGRSQLFVDLGQHDGEELQTPMIMDKAKLYNQLRKFKLVEAMYSYPVDYRTDNPLADSYYNPQAWYVMGQKVHASRLLLFVAHPLPNLLKPAYNFGGMSMSQLAMPYVDNWLSTRNAINRMIRNFSITGIATDMQAVLNGDSGDDIISRAELYNAQRDNQGLYMLNKETEEMFQHNTPLTTLDALQAQSQEHMSSISSIPLIVLFGISPTGLNASSDGEIRVWYDYVKDMQESLFRDNLQKVIEIIQLSKWGQVDPDITFDFVPLWEADATEVSAVRKANAETDQLYMDMGVISSQEIRSNLSQDPDSGYTGLPEINPELVIKNIQDEEAERTEGIDPKADPSEPGERGGVPGPDDKAD